MARKKKPQPVTLTDEEREIIGTALRAIARIPGKVFVHPLAKVPEDDLKALAARLQPDREWNT